MIINLSDTGFWKTETCKDYGAPIVRRSVDGRREGLLASYGMVPRKRIPPGVRPFDTMNALAETVGQLRSCCGEAGPEHSFTQLTINADEHPLIKRFHKPDEEKRALVILPQAEWDDWLDCTDPEYARSFLRPLPCRADAWLGISGTAARQKTRASHAGAQMCR
ncbi:hypothetical protein [Duganella margarita]|uniref:hypothetical protein n=1 Tax=Duganella margarita TaxID=2692170 RepID=UPI00192972DD|nr:hypothetical protein [Duganella margarita]